MSGLNRFLLLLLSVFSICSGKAQQLKLDQLGNFDQVFENQILFNKDGSVLIPGKNANEQFILEEYHSKSTNNWSMVLPIDFNLLDVNTHPVENKYGLIVSKGKSKQNIIEFWEIDRSNPDHRRIIRIDLDSSFNPSWGIILYPSNDSAEIFLLDTSSQSITWIQISNDLTISKALIFQSPYPERRIEYLNCYFHDSSRVILNNYEGKLTIETWLEDRNLRFEKSEYCFLGTNVRHPKDFRISGFYDERLGGYNSWIPVKHENGKFYRHSEFRNFSFDCYPFTGIYGTNLTDSVFVYPYPFINSVDGKTEVRLHYVTSEMENISFDSYRVPFCENITSVFVQVISVDSLNLFLVNKLGNGSEYLYKATIEGTVPFDSSNVCLKETGSNFTKMPVIAPWANGHKTVVGIPMVTVSSATIVEPNNLSGFNTYNLCSFTVSNNSNDCYLPNSITPNGDNLNDEFFPTGENISLYRIRIFNEHGVLIFEGENVPWNGSYVDYSGKQMCQYIIDITFVNGETKVFKGSILVLQ